MAGFHTAFYGATMTGKTTLARAFARNYAAAGLQVVVYDPVGTITAGGGWPESAWVYDDPDEFVRILDDESFPPAMVFIDEAADVFGHTCRDNFWLATRGRHYNLFLHIITQRPKLIHPSVRNQVAKSYVFRMSMEDMAEVFRDAGQNGHKQIELDTGDFLVLNSGAREIQRGNVFSLLEGKSA